MSHATPITDEPEATTPAPTPRGPNPGSSTNGVSRLDPSSIPAIPALMRFRVLPQGFFESQLSPTSTAAKRAPAAGMNLPAFVANFATSRTTCGAPLRIIPNCTSELNPMTIASKAVEITCRAPFTTCETTLGCAFPNPAFAAKPPLHAHGPESMRIPMIMPVRSVWLMGSLG